MRSRCVDHLTPCSREHVNVLDIRLLDGVLQRLCRCRKGDSVSGPTARETRFMCSARLVGEKETVLTHKTKCRHRLSAY